MFNKIAEFISFIFLGACMALGPALPYVIGVIAAMFGLGVFVGLIF